MRYQTKNSGSLLSFAKFQKQKRNRKSNALQKARKNQPNRLLKRDLLKGPLPSRCAPSKRSGVIMPASQVASAPFVPVLPLVPPPLVLPEPMVATVFTNPDGSLTRVGVSFAAVSSDLLGTWCSRVRTWHGRTVLSLLQEQIACICKQGTCGGIMMKAGGWSTVVLAVDDSCHVSVRLAFTEGLNVFLAAFLLICSAFGSVHPF
jgi:hypothetical protein